MKKSLYAAAAVLGLVATTTFAQTIEETGQGIRFLLGNDRYEAGNTIIVSEPLGGDLFAAGSQILVEEAVGGDIHAAGSAVSITETVGDDVRAAGSHVVLKGDVRGDAMLAGAIVDIHETVTIDGSAAITGESVTINGDILGNVKIDAQKLTINGTISGTATINAKTFIHNGVIIGNTTVRAKEITLGEGAAFQNDLRYWTMSSQEEVGARVQGTATYDDTMAISKSHDKRSKAGIATGILGAVSAWYILASLVLLIILSMMTKNFFIDTAKTLKQSPGMSFLWGFLYFALIPALAFVCLLTVIGIPVGLILLLMYAATILVAAPMSALTYARLLEQRKKRKKKWTNTVVIAVALLITIGLKLLWIIPAVGFVLSCALICFGYGAVLRSKAERFKKVA